MIIIQIYLVGVLVSFILSTLTCIFNDQLAALMTPFCEKMEFEKTPNTHLLTWKDHWNNMKLQVLTSWIGVIFTIVFFTSGIMMSVHIKSHQTEND